MVTAKRKRAKPVWITFDGKWRQVKLRGISEPKDRLKTYRVEIRPPGSKKKIWVGTFGTRDKAQRAYDAAVVLIGKKPHYFLYPDNYFPGLKNTSGNFLKLKSFVKKEAKNFAEKNDRLDVNPSSLIPEDRKQDPYDQGLVEELGDEQIVEEWNGQDPVEDMNYRDPVQDMDDQEAPVEDVNELGDLGDQELVEDMVPAAYRRGLKAADSGVVNALLDYPPPDSFNLFAPIQDGAYSILDVFEIPIPSPEIEPAHAQFGGADCSRFPVGGYDDYPSW